MPRCLNCSKPNREGARFCEECGARISNPTTMVSTAPGSGGTAIGCPVCGLQNAPHMNFCRRCGGRLPKDAARPTMPFSSAARASSTEGRAPSIGVLMPPPAPRPAASPKLPCPACKGLTPLGFSFCQNCGAKMPGEDLSPVTPAPAVAAATPPTTGSVNKAPPPAPAVPVATPRAATKDSHAPSRPTPIGVPATALPPAPAAAAPADARVRLVAIQRDGADGHVHEIEGDNVALGRRNGHINFDNDPYLADRHARIERRDGRWVLVDMGSRNGTFLRVRGPVPLGSEEILLAGKQVLEFELLPKEQPEAHRAEEHGVLVFGTPVVPAWARLRQLTTSGVARDVYHLTREEMALGREDGDILFPEDEFMSRCHVVLQHRDGTATMVDQGSSNGTYMRIRGEREIVGGDHIRLGDQLLRFEIA